MEEGATSFEQIEASFALLRKAVEERDYPTIEHLLKEQRRLLSSTASSGARLQTIVLRGSALIAWALTMVKIQHAGYAQELATILNTKQLQLQYGTETTHPPELVCFNA